MSSSFFLNWGNATIVSAMPLLIACLGTIIAGRAGVLSLGTEGFMAMGAMSGANAALTTGSVGLGLFVAAGTGMLLAALFAVATVLLRADQVVAGLATSALGTGLSGFLGRDIAQQPTPALSHVPFGRLVDLPIIGPIFFAQDVLFYAALAFAAAVAFFLNRTLAGLRLRAVGEHPAAADAAGLHVVRIRMLAVVVGGGICALGGAYLSLASAQVWVENMVAGRGWIAVALVIFASWTPGRSLFGALMFGAIDALVPRLQAAGVSFPTFLLMSAPYLATIAVLVISRLLGSPSLEPKALGQAFLREDRT